ncbi:MAG TPA: glycoside hydrolase family 2 TIM barrel-domain containing protein, partial [Polyangiaceae bacterium]|nr:glycoside hydrolase family 2 TIM barrel-domain containing protein [Polyangiaceae bacterium]
ASLNGLWDFAIDVEGEWKRSDVVWDRQIRVPFSPEAPASGIGDTGHYKRVWYRLRFRAPSHEPTERILLHFGAVDYAATVWVNGRRVVEHEGGYTPFHADITDALEPGEEQEVVVRCDDDPGDLEKPRGKQDWQLDPHSIWYPRTTGIWQTVWLERVPLVRLTSITWVPSVDRWEIGLHAFVLGAAQRKLRVSVRLWVDDLVLAEDQYLVVAGEVHRGIALSDPGIDDFRNELLWSPFSPKLIQADVELLDEEQRQLDCVRSYTALRAFTVQGHRFVLNGRPYPLRLVLDQGYWPDSGLTPGSDAEMRRDVELAKSMGFNGVRKHQKIELPRYLYWADVLGLLVWEEMPSAYRFTPRSVERLTQQWLEVMRRDASHPSIMAWVPFNESWGVPNLPQSPAEQNYVRALYYLTKTQDPSRPVVGNDGWESVTTDIIGIHDYEDDPERMARRYYSPEVPKLLARERPGGRALVLAAVTADQPIVLSEFGGIAVVDREQDCWGYSVCTTTQHFEERFRELLRVVRSLELFAGFCYTQFCDTHQEANGLLRFDRSPKIPLKAIAEATTGSATGVPRNELSPEIRATPADEDKPAR